MTAFPYSLPSNLNAVLMMHISTHINVLLLYYTIVAGPFSNVKFYVGLLLTNAAFLLGASDIFHASAQTEPA